MRMLMPSATTLLALAAPALAQPADLSGKYIMEGRMDGPQGETYKGECELRHAGQHYDVLCLNGDDRYTGKGMASGDVFSLYLGEYLLVYRVEPGHRLNGVWVHILSQATGKEILTPITR